MQSSLYYDIPKTERYEDLINRLEQYANEKSMDVFLFRVPKSDLDSKSYEQDGCFIIMSPGYKLSMVNAYASVDDYDDYVDDVNNIINYLYSKYEYRDELGRFNKWGAALLDEDNTLEDLADLVSFWEKQKLTDRLQIRYSEILVALCSGSVNDIKQVKAGLPLTMLDQVKQKIQAFDADQTRFIYKELNQPLVKIQGLSGTGKTELLLHKLKELYQNPKEFKIYVTCHNKILADNLRNRIPHFFNVMKVSTQIEWDKRLWCTNAWGRQGNANSGLYRYICEFYRIPFYSYSYNTDFDTVCKSAISYIKHNYPNNNRPKPFDYVLVDECQDFKESFIELCQLVVSQKVYLAGDVFQSIFSEHSGKDYQADFFLTKCYRTNPKTLMFAHALGLGLFETNRLRWLSPADWEACGYKYKEIEDGKKLVLTREPVRRFLDFENTFKCIDLVLFGQDNLYKMLVEQISNILHDFPTATVNDFCIIFLDSEQYVYTMANALESVIYDKLGWRVNKAYENKKKIIDTLLISNRNNVKGLEYPFVICLSKKISSGYVYRNSIYTMLTRSFLKTILFLPNTDSAIEGGIIEGYKEIMDTGKMTITIPSAEEQEQIQERFTKAKNRRSLTEIVKDTIAQLGLNPEDALKIERAASSFDWTDMQEDEIVKKVHILKGLI